MLQVLRSWLERTPRDFAENINLFDRLVHFVDKEALDLAEEDDESLVDLQRKLSQTCSKLVRGRVLKGGIECSG